MAKKIIPAAVPLPYCWDSSGYEERQRQRDFTNQVNLNIEKADTILRPRQTNDGERTPPIVPGAFRVGCFKKQCD